jgi:hypothetical protein
MLLMGAILLVCMVLVGFAPAVGAETTAYRHLNTDEIKTLLQGSRITQPVVQQLYARTMEDFEQDGTHVRYTDNYEGRGKYRIQNNSVCVTDERERDFCRSVLIDGDGGYWITKRNDRSGLVRISVTPIPR